jgi:HEAT repeat protein
LKTDRILLFALALLSMSFLSIGCGQSSPTMAHGQPLDYWVKSLQNPDAKLRKKAAQVLGNIGAADSSVVPALSSALKDPNTAVRSEAVLSLTKMGPKAKDALAALSEISRDRDAKIRAQVEKAIHAIQGER